MSKKTKLALSQRLSRYASCLALVGFLLVANPQPAHADFLDVAAITALQVMQKIQVAFQAAVQSAGQWMQSQISVKLQDNANANGRATQIAGAMAGIAATNARPPQNGTTGTSGTGTTGNACHNSEAAATRSADKVAVAGFAQAAAQAGGNVPKTAAQNAKDIEARCKLFVPPTGGAIPDAQASAYAALGCAAGEAQHARQDQTIASLLKPLEYPMPATYPALTNGTYAPITAAIVNNVEKYYPFAAALTYCQHVTPKLPVPPQGSSSNPTVGLTAIGGYVNAESAASVAPSACLTAFAKRMQVGQDASNYATLHTSQVARCMEDNKAHLLDDSAYTDCQTNGRSDLQADHDEAYRLATTTYHTNVLANVTPDTEQLLYASGWSAQQAFEHDLLIEGQEVQQAIDAGNKVSAPNSSTLNNPTQASSP